MGKRVKNIPAIFDLEARFRTMDQFDEYTQLLSLGSPPVEGRSMRRRLRKCADR